MLLRLRPLKVTDELAFRQAHDELAAEGFEFGLAFDPDAPFSDYVGAAAGRRIGANLPAGWVSETFLVAVVDDVLVGRLSVRHDLTDYLREFGGHIGYAVSAEHRRQGYASEMLRQALVISRSLGVDRALLTCDDDNTASVRVIERNGGTLEDRIQRPGGGVTRRYWID
jgi:predicted acetyltransferase